MKPVSSQSASVCFSLDGRKAKSSSKSGKSGIVSGLSLCGRPGIQDYMCTRLRYREACEEYPEVAGEGRREGGREREGERA